jgi:hypothetical protein
VAIGECARCGCGVEEGLSLCEVPLVLSPGFRHTMGAKARMLRVHRSEWDAVFYFICGHEVRAWDINQLLTASA